MTAIQEYCHEIWHWIYKDYEKDMADYPVDKHGKYVFGKNSVWDFIEGSASYKCDELFNKFKIPSNISGEYQKALVYYNEKKDMI